MNPIDPGQRAEILANYDRLIAQGKKPKEARDEVIKQWKFVSGLNESKIYNAIQHECRRRKQQPKVETEVEVKTEPVKAETTGPAEAETTEVEAKAEPVESETTGAATATIPTLEELEAKVQEAWKKAQEASWEWAVAVTAIHDSKCYPGAGENDSWAAYMHARWNVRRAYAYRPVAWVHHEVSLTLVPMLPADLDHESQYPAGYSGSQNNESQSTTVDSGSQNDESQYPAGYSGSQESPPAKAVAPAKPVYATEWASRAARTKPRKIKGKLNEDELDALRKDGKIVQIEGSADYMSRKEADQQVQEGDLVKMGDKYFRPGESEPLSFVIESGIPMPEPEEDLEEVKASEAIFAVLDDYRARRGLDKYTHFLTIVFQRIDRDMNEIEDANAD